MLLELRIDNFAIIDELNLELGPGLVVFTGETGAGKSIIIDAVETLLGVRADSAMIRTEERRSSVEGTFKIMPAVRQEVHAILKENELLDNEDFVTLAREFRREGRNVARVNGRTVNLAILKELGEYLIDLHGQSEHLSLLRVANHLLLLDRFAESENELSDYRGSYQQLIAVRKELAQLKAAEADAARQTELLTFQVNEIEAAALEPDEEQRLKEERTRLANAESLANKANQALAALDSSDEPEGVSASDRLGETLEALEGLVKVDQTKESMVLRANELFEGMVDLSRELRKYLEEIEFNPNRLEQVEERLGLIHNLKRKYGEDIPAILAYANKAQKDLETITHAEERMQELTTKEQELLALLTQKALVLSEKRHQAAERLSHEIEQELQDLRMAQASFAVDFRTKPDPTGILLPSGDIVEFNANGFEQVEFLIAPNPGEGLKPLVKIASGGETARLMLALKNVLAKADNTSTLIFDEIDQGIGGRVGAVVGQKLWNLGRNHQVLCITHLAQLAGYGDEHFKVSKQVGGGRTITIVDKLKGDDRLVELAQMLGEVSEGTLQSANEILQSVNHSTT
jgi:DNA repair protein RecN (Recombination protein N)